MDLILERFSLFAGLIYTVLQFVKPVYDHENHKWNFDNVAAIALGIAVAVLARLDLVAMVGIRFSVPYVGMVLSGVLLGGSVGAGLIHDIPDWLLQIFGRKAVS